MKIQDAVKDYKLPVEESGWEAIAQDTRLVRFNRRKRLQRVCLYGMAPLVVAAAILTVVSLSISSKKSESVPVLKTSNTEVVVRQMTPIEKENQGTVNSACVAEPQSAPIAEQSVATHSPSQPLVKEYTPMAVSAAPKPSVPSTPIAVKIEKRTPVSASGLDPIKPSMPVESTPVVSVKSQDNGEQSQVEPETPSDQYQLFIPNAFTPNGDGINDLFKVEADFTPLSFEIAIYSRKGELVFLNKDIKLGWDGTFRGKELPNEIYNYMVKFADPEGKQSTRRGQITLIR